MKRQVLVPVTVIAGMSLPVFPLLLTGVLVSATVPTSLVDGCLGGGDVVGRVQQIGDRTWSPEQLDNAHTIVRTTAARDLPRRAAVIAVATAMTESRLRNLPYGDQDSLGLFQQRPSMGWGTPEQVTDPVYATNAFLDRLVEVPNWRHRPLAEVAQAVQHSAFPDRYARWEDDAQQVVDRFWRNPDNPPDDSADPPDDSAGNPVQLAARTVTIRCPDRGSRGNVLPARRKPPPGQLLPVPSAVPRTDRFTHVEEV